MEFQKGVGKKLYKVKRKGPANLHRPEIETVVDPFVIREPVEIHRPISTGVTSESISSSLSTDVCPVISSNQLMQLNVSTSTPISTVNVNPSNVNSDQVTTQSTVISAGQFQLKFLTCLIKVCAGL